MKSFRLFVSLRETGKTSQDRMHCGDIEHRNLGIGAEAKTNK